MPTPRTTPRSSSPGRRAGRTTPPAGRLGRSTPPAGRFGRTPATRTSPSARLAARRKPAPRSKSSKALNGLAGLIPGSALGKAAKPTPGGGKGKKAGFALLAGAAGLALKNRDKLPGPFGSKTEEPYEAAPVEAVPVTPDPLATTPVPPATPSAAKSNASTASTPPAS